MDKMPLPRKRKSLDWESIIQPGQNVNGFTAQTANGTAKAGPQPGWNKNYQWPTSPQVEPTGAWTNANRTGE